jgi:hypothetical protein
MNRYFIKNEFIDNALIALDNTSHILFSEHLLDQYGFFRKNDYNSELKTIYDIAEQSGAILLAEGGMGKSYVMDELSTSFSSELMMSITLPEYQGDANGLVNDITSLAETIQYIFIDGLDEASELIPSLLRGLKKILFQPKIFIASRNIPQLNAVAKELFLPLYSLLPLSQENICKIASEQNISGKKFIEQVICVGLGAICAKPLGCNMLLAAYAKDGLANTQSDVLWHQAILRLCAENDSTSRRLNASSPVSANICFEYASKMALILKLSGRSIINRISAMPPSNIAVDFSSYGNEFAYKVFNEILERGLFISVGPDQFRFAHASYFDYLAAIGISQYIDKRHRKVILLSPDQSAVYPQWEGAVAWIAAFDSEWRKIILDIQPELLLVSDDIIQVVGADKICQALIDRADNLDFWRRHDAMLRSRLSKLKCSDSIVVLKNVFAKSSSIPEQEIAIEVIRECRIQELENYLVKKFCDQSEDLSLRKTIGYALAEFASNNARSACKTILEQENCSLDLKGILFIMTWPELISIREIAPHLESKERHIIDAYDSWLTHECPESLLEISYDKSLELLKWATSDIQREDDYRTPILDLKRQIYTLCWEKFDTPEIYALLTDGYLNFQKIHISPFADKSIYGTPERLIYTEDMFLSDQAKRYRLADCLIENPNTTGKELTTYPFPILSSIDIEHVFFKIETEEKEISQRKWTLCLCCLLHGVPLPEMSERWNNIHGLFPDILTNNATETINIREEYNQKNTITELARKTRLAEEKQITELRRNENICQTKKLLAEGNAAKYFYNIINFFSNETSINTIDYRSTDIWQEFTPDEISRLAIAAKDFLFKTESPKSSPGSYARAFYILYTENYKEFKKIPENIWAKFALELFNYYSVDNKNILKPIFEYMANTYPSTFSDALVQKTRNEILQGYSFNYNKIKDILNPAIYKNLVQICKNDALDDKQCFLLLNSIQKIFPDVVKSYLSNDVLDDKLIYQYGHRTIILILDYWPDRISELIDYIERDSNWGKQWFTEIIEMNHYDHPLMPIFKQVSLKNLKRLYIWLHQNYPSAEEPVHEGVFCSNALDYIYRFINSLFNLIMEYPEIGVVATLQEIYERFPTDQWLVECILRAQKSELKLLNPVYSITEIKKLLGKRSDGYLVTSPQGLLNVVIECLHNYQTYLTGKENPRVEDLWNYNKSELTHKPEEAFSDHIKAYLDLTMRASGMVINREVQLNRGRNGEAGSRTDIWITALSKDQLSNISLCIEVKGSWNSSASTAMEEQLVKKYMGAGGADAGILLVGWYTPRAICGIIIEKVP